MSFGNPGRKIMLLIKVDDYLGSETAFPRWMEFESYFGKLGWTPEHQYMPIYIFRL